MLPCRDIFAVPDTVLLHRRFTLRRARHSSAARFVSALLQTGSTRINCTKCLIRRCRALQRAKELRGTVMPRLRRLSGLCSSNVSDTANILRNKRQSNPTAVPPFRSGHMSAICARLGSKGKVGVQRGRKTAGCPSFLPLRRAPHVSALRRAQIPLNRRRKPRFNIDFTRKHTLYLNLTNSRFCILQNFRKIIL